MKTERFDLTDAWQQVASAAGMVTLQTLYGQCYIYVGQTAPAADAPYVVLSQGETVDMGDTVLAWVRGQGVAVAITV